MSTIKTRRQAKAVADDAATTIAISIPDDVDPDALAALLPGISLDSPSPDNILALYRLVMEQADEIDAKQQSIDEARADIEKKDVELDQALQDKETLSSDLDSQIQTLQDELKEVKSERDKLLTSQAELRMQISRISSSQSASSSEVEELQHRLKETDREKRDLLAVVSRLKQDESQRDEEIQTLRKNLKEARQEHQELENQLRELRSTDTSSKFKLDSLSQQLQLAQAEVERVNTELTSKAEEFTKYRKSKQAELATLQSNYDSVCQNHDSAQASLKALQSSHSTQTRQLTQALTKVHDVSAQLAEQEAVFNNEANGLRRLVSVLETREKQAKEIVESIEKEWAEVNEKTEKQEADFKAELDREKRGRAEAEKKVDHLQTVVEKMGLGELPPLPSRLPGTPMRGGDSSIDGMMGLSPTVAIASRVQRSGKTFTEVYTDYVKLQEEYETKCQEYEHMDRTLTSVLRQIEERAPVLSQQRAEYERLQSEAVQLASQLAQTITDRDSQSILAQENGQKCVALQRENKLFEQQLNDLGRQVQNLLREIGRRDDPTLPADEDLDDSEVVQSNDVSSMITNNLVLFKSIPGLQQQNQKVLQVVRGLANKMEAGEAEYREAMEKEQAAAIQEAHQAIEEMAAQLERQKKSSDGIIQTYVKEREAMKGMIARLEAGASSGSVNGHTSGMDASKDFADIQSQFDAYRAEMGVDSVRLREDLAAAQKEVGKLQVDIAKEKARSDYLNERNRISQEEYTLRAQELEEANKRNQQLYDQWTRVDIECARVSEDLRVATSRMEQLRNESANLRAEKNIWESVQNRLVDENKTLSLERSHLSDMMSNIQKMNADNQRSSENDRRRLESQLELLESQIQDNRSQLSDERDNVRRITLQKELETRDLQNRVEKLSEDLAKTRESLIAAETSKKHLEQRVEDLSKYTESNKEKLAVYERHGSTSTSSGPPSDLTSEQQLQTEVAELSAKLKVAERDLEKAKERVIQYESMSRASEDALGQLHATFDEYKLSTDAALAKHQSTISGLEEKLATAESDVVRATNSLKELQSTLDSERLAWTKDKNELEGTIVELSTSEKYSESDRTSRETEMREQRERTKAAEERYQQEVVAHAEDIKAVTALREQLSELQATSRDKVVAAETAIAKLSASEASWNQQKQILEKEVAEHSKRFKDLQSQNKVLIQQFDDFAKQAERARQSSASGAPGDDDGVGEGRSSEVPQVVNYLRDQNQYLEVQLDAKQAENARLKAQADHLNHELDETRTILSQEREKAVENAASASQHSELVQRIEQLNILRESNATLRADAERHSKRVKLLETQLKDVSGQLEPAKEQLRVAQAELQASKAHITRLETECKRWQDRNTQLLSKYDRIDPAEMQALQEEISRLKEKNAELDAKVLELEAVNSKAISESKTLRDRFGVFKKAHDRYKEEALELPGLRAELQKEKTAYDEEKATLTTKISSLESEIKVLQEAKTAAEASPSKAVDPEEAKKTADIINTLKRHNVSMRTELEKWGVEREKWAAEKALLTQASQATGDEATRILFDAEKASIEKAREDAEGKVKDLEEKIEGLTEELTANRDAIAKLNVRLNASVQGRRDDAAKAIKDQEAAVKTALDALRVELQKTSVVPEETTKKHLEELEALKAAHQKEMIALKVAAGPIPAEGSAALNKILADAQDLAKREVNSKIQLKDRLLLTRTKALQNLEKRCKHWLAQGYITEEQTKVKVPGVDDVEPTPSVGSAAALISPAITAPPVASTSSAPPPNPAAAKPTPTRPANQGISANGAKATKPLPDKSLGAPNPAAAILRGGAAGGAARGAPARGGAAARGKGAARGAAPNKSTGPPAQQPGEVSILGASMKRPREEVAPTDDPQAKRPRPVLKRPPPPAATGGGGAGAAAS